MTTWIKRLAAVLLICIIAAIGYGAYLMHSASRSVPVLNYHQINDWADNALTVHTDQFDAQMKYLADNGYTAITPDEMLDAWENHTELPEKPVIITFDDGYVDNYRNAFPILQKYNLKGTIFLISDYVSTYPNYLTWSQTEEMQESGLIDFESHTLSHEELTKAPSLEEAQHQLAGSKKALEWNLGKEVRFIAYPCGEYDEDIEELTKAAGYRAAFTVHYGLAAPGEDPFILDRVPIFGSNSHTIARFKLRLRLAPLLAPLNDFKTSLGKQHPWLAHFSMVP